MATTKKATSAKTTRAKRGRTASPARGQQPATGNAQKDPATWATGAEPMTGAQKSYLTTLSEEAGVQADTSLSKAAASEQIDALRERVVMHRTDDSPDASNTQKDPHHWATGDEPMTGAQRSYLKTLSEEAGIAFDESLSKGEASMRIDELRKGNPRVAGE